MFSKTFPLLLLLLLAVATVLAADAAADEVKNKEEDSTEKKPSPDAKKHDDDEGGEEDEGDVRDEEDHTGNEDAQKDHEAFLGSDGSHRFDDLSPSQAQKALLDVLPKIDSNGDGKVSAEEMQAWLAAVSKRESRIKSDRRFEEIKLFNHALDVSAPMVFDEYKAVLHDAVIGNKEGDKKAEEDFNNQLVKDQARWAKADANGDNLLTKVEFADFRRPEEAPHMREVIIQEVMMSADKNKDGKIDLNEFLTELHPNYEADVKEKKKLPKWLPEEEKKFKEELDSNKDGILDHNEIYKWIVPDDYDQSRKETEHLFQIADKDNDKQLTKEEILEKWQNFVGHKVEKKLRDEL